MNLFNTSLLRATVKMSMKRMRKARRMAIRGVGTTDAGRVGAVMPETDHESGAGSVKDWTDAMKIRTPKKITAFIRRKLRY